MTSRPTLFRLILALLLVAFCSAPCLAWWPIAHYVIAKNAGYTDLAPYAQLPDYVDSYRISLNPLEWGGFLNDQFLWGHALQSHGSVEWVPLRSSGDIELNWLDSRDEFGGPHTDFVFPISGSRHFRPLS